MYIENDYLKVAVHRLGAEVQSIKDQKQNVEFLWQGDDVYWSRRSPILFPIIGGLKEDEYVLNNKKHKMSKHGFLRDSVFDVSYYRKDRVTLHFLNYGSINGSYPFDCSVYITYELYENTLLTTYRIVNEDKQPLYYSIGGHPGFNLSEPVRVSLSGHGVSRYLLENGLITESVETDDLVFELKPEMFVNDALIYDNISEVNLHMKDRIIHLDVSEFDYVGLWAPYRENEMAPFVCVEPWQGLPDTLSHQKDLKQKKGIQHLQPHDEALFTFKGTFNYGHSI